MDWGRSPARWLITMHVCYILGSRLGLLKAGSCSYLECPQLPSLCALANAKHACHAAAAPCEVVHVLCLHATAWCSHQILTS